MAHLVVRQDVPMSAPRLWLVRRRWPLLATAALVAIGMISTTVGGHPGKLPWALPDDLWGTLAAARRLLHLDLAGL